jgi:hypothetical protein
MFPKNPYHHSHPMYLPFHYHLLLKYLQHLKYLQFPFLKYLMNP